MQRPDEMRREIEALPDRISKPRTAILLVAGVIFSLPARG